MILGQESCGPFDGRVVALEALHLPLVKEKQVASTKEILRASFVEDDLAVDSLWKPE